MFSSYWASRGSVSEGFDLREPQKGMVNVGMNSALVGFDDRKSRED